MAEAKEMVQAASFDKDKTEVIFVYGLGLGYIFDELSDWLAGNRKRHLVILENDLEVIDFFLHTERATRFLENPQTVLFYFHNCIQDAWSFIQLHFTFINLTIQYLALPYYAKTKTVLASRLCYMLLHNHSLYSGLANEFLSGQKGFLSQFYRNILDLPDSYLAGDLFGKFKNVPAIICGAGPSINQNLHILRELQDRALIFAGGSALNILNKTGLMPHFGVGVDPNREQMHRLITNDAFHLPFFYRPRFSHDSLNFVGGPRLYVQGSMLPLPQWIEEKLGIPPINIDEGHNVINLCTEIAYRLGCNPIIYVGMDLAFTEAQSYAAGLETHPLWIEQSRPYDPAGKQVVVFRKDIFGKNTKTKWEWIAESDWLSMFARKHPDAFFINSTEGGIGFAPVPNISLQMVRDAFLLKPYNVDDLVHTMIQNHPKPFSQAGIFSLLSEIRVSLTECVEQYTQILEEKKQQMFRARPDKVIEYFTASTILREIAIHEQVAYKNLLKSFDNIYGYLQSASANIQTGKKSPFCNLLFRFAFVLMSQNKISI